MKYALLIYDTCEAWDGLSAEESESVLGEYRAIAELPAVIGGRQLQAFETATTVRVDEGETLATDGPFAESKEFLGGYYEVEAQNLDEALAVASRIPAARMGGAVEVRPIVER